MLLLINKEFFKNKISFLKYSLIQAISFGIDLLIFYNFYFFLISSIFISNFISKFISSVFSFVCHRYLTFNKKDKENVYNSILRYYLFVILNIPITSCLTFLIDIMILNILFQKFQQNYLFCIRILHK